MRNFLQKKAATHGTADALGVSTNFLWPLQPSTLNPVTTAECDWSSLHLQLQLTALSRIIDLPARVRQSFVCSDCAASCLLGDT